MTKSNYTKYLGLAVAIGIGVVMAWSTRQRVVAPAPPELSRDSEPHGTTDGLHREPSSQDAPMMDESEPETIVNQGQDPAALASAEHHGSPSAAGDGVPVGKVEKASGKHGKTVAEIYADRRSLVGQKVQVRAVVVRCTSGVLGRTFVHLRDGSGNPQNGDHDLTVTTDVERPIGDTVLFTGTVVLDKDFGSGYRYPVLLEQATVERD